MTNEEIIEAITATGQFVLICPARAGYRVSILKPACGKVQYVYEAATLADCLFAIALEMRLPQ